MTSLSMGIGHKLQELVLLLLGPSRAGKSTAGNIIAGDKVFPIADRLLTWQTRQYTFTHETTCLRLIDTVGLDEKLRPIDDVLTELTTAVLMAADAGGVHAFLICSNLESLFSSFVMNELLDLQQMNNFWPHAVMLFTSAGIAGQTEGEREAALKEIITNPQCPHTLSWLVSEAQEQIVLLEYNDIDLDQGNGGDRETKVDDIVTWVKVFAANHGAYTNAMIQDAKQCWEEFKFEAKEKRKQLDPNYPYQDLAIQIVQAIGIGNVHPGCYPFSLIHHGIRELRKRRGEGQEYYSEPPTPYPSGALYAETQRPEVYSAPPEPYPAYSGPPEPYPAYSGPPEPYPAYSGPPEPYPAYSGPPEPYLFSRVSPWPSSDDKI